MLCLFTQNVLEQGRKEMYRDILDVLVCPICKGKFWLEERELEGQEVIEGSLICEKEHRFAIRKGVIDFGSQEQEGFNQWSEFLKENNFEELDREVEEQKSDKEKAWQQKHIKSIVEEVAKLDKGCVVDVASGRGMLLSQLVENVKEEVNIIATDLSFDILMYDQIKIRKRNPNARVNYIACDATIMPLADECADVVVSFYGIANMVGIVEAGIKEAGRITNKNGKFLNAYLVIKEDSEGFYVMKKLCEENNMPGAERVCLNGVMEELYKNYFNEGKTHIIVEDVYDETENKLDLLPYKGEWFAYMTYEGRK